MSDIEIDRYYKDCYSRVNYEGVGGYAARIQHRAQERPFRGQHFGHVLEIGAANGDHFQFVQHTFDEYVMSDIVDRGVDLSGLSLIKNPLGSIKFEIANAECLHYEDNTFDRVLFTCVLHHLREPEKALREVRRVLKVGGTVSCYLPCDPGVLYMSTQRFTTRRQQRKALSEGKFQFDVDYLRAIEHPGHFSALRAIMREVFKSDELDLKYWPFRLPIWNMNYFLLFNAVKS